MYGGEGDSDRYIITYADLITLLLGLFILLYSSSNVDLQKYRKVVKAAGNYFGAVDSTKIYKPGGNTANPAYAQMANQGVDPFQRLQQQLEDVVNEEKLSKSIKLVSNERGITIRILDDILFRSGDAALSEYSKIILHKIGSILQSLKNDIRIEGHTDNVPIANGAFPSNWHLSVERATNTGYYLMSKESLEPGRVSVVGYSEYHPVASNETVDGRANNRRVDIVILK
ncbi:MAG: OmpA family protein [Ignavibacteriales bacterium]|nr:OmpA family protein [Ignavibacteriales bacterium]